MVRRTLFEDDDAPVVTSLAALHEAENACNRCPIHKITTHAVAGEGARHARMMLIGEQPGDKEDLAGRPFVGPAGQLLDRALEDAGIARSETYVTNAVKRFKHEMRGKRRLHKRPNAQEIDRCRWWLEQERRIVDPDIVVMLGATSVRGVLGRSATISSLRGKILPLQGGATGFVTVHPSALLRIQDATDKKREYRAFVADLRRAAEFLRKRKAA